MLTQLILRVLKTMALSFALLSATAQAITLKLATVAPEGTTWMNEMRAGGDEIEQRTEGRVKLKFYPGGVMGTGDTVMRKMRVGQLHGGAFTGGELAEVSPDFFLYTLPFLFRSEQEVDYVRQSMDPLLATALESRGMVLLGLTGGGFVYLMSDHQVDTIDALAKSKVWVPEGDPVSEMALRICGVAPVPIPLSDVYTALQTGVIDTVLNTPVGAIAFQWHTKMRYVADFPVAYVIGAMAVDKRAFGKVSPQDQAVVKEVIEAVFTKLDGINRKDNVNAREALINQGISYLPLDAASLERWREVGDQTIDAVRDSDLDITHLETLVDTLKAYRSSTQSPDQASD